MWVSAGNHSAPEAIDSVTPCIKMCFLKRKDRLNWCDGCLPVYTQNLFQLFCDLLRLQGFLSCHLPVLPCEPAANCDQSVEKARCLTGLSPLCVGSPVAVVYRPGYSGSLLSVLLLPCSPSPVVCSSLAAVANLLLASISYLPFQIFQHHCNWCLIFSSLCWITWVGLCITALTPTDNNHWTSKYWNSNWLMIFF